MSLYTFWGKVKKGAKRGRLLGFPTANISLHKQIPEGIYVSLAKVGPLTKNTRDQFVKRSDLQQKTSFPAATFIGSAKTFEEKDYKAESYILDFDKQIYGKWITITLLQKIRGNKKFSGEKELIAQMKKDIEEVRKYFTS